MYNESSIMAGWERIYGDPESYYGYYSYYGGRDNDDGEEDDEEDEDAEETCYDD